MKLKIIDLINETSILFENMFPMLEEVEKIVVNLFTDLFDDFPEMFIGTKSRIKQTNSLREKIIRNRLYKECSTGHEIINILPDIVGVTIQCRFISDEAKMFKIVKSVFTKSKDDYFQCKLDKNLYLNLRMQQPQIQKNGIELYRIDGYYMYDNHRITFELQIKSLIHGFWAELEHKVIYKNNNLINIDDFLKGMLLSVNESLEIADYQLEQVYNKIKKDSVLKDIYRMEKTDFNKYLSRLINDLYTVKMVESFGISSNFKNSSEVLSEYIYIKYFSDKTNKIEIFEYFDSFKGLELQKIDFTEAINIKCNISDDDIFSKKLGEYWQQVINEDFDWHCFFVMLFAIEPTSDDEDFNSFVNIIKNLMVPCDALDEALSRFNNSKYIKDLLLETLVDTLISYHKIDMIFYNKIMSLSYTFFQFIKDEIGLFKDEKELLKNQDKIKNDLAFMLNTLLDR